MKLGAPARADRLVRHLIKRKSMSRRGGKRPGAGRPQGRRSKATADQKLTLEELARSYTEIALNVLIEVAQHGQSEAARVSAANAILDRGYGKPRQVELAVASPEGTAERSAETMVSMRAEFDELLNASLSQAAAGDTKTIDEDQRPSLGGRAEPLPLWAQQERSHQSAAVTTMSVRRSRNTW